MSNYNFYMSNLLSIINGGTKETNPLYYHTKNFNMFKYDCCISINNNDYVGSNSLDIDDKENMYTFKNIDEKIYITQINFKQNTNKLFEIGNTENFKIHNLKIINDTIWYTTIDNLNQLKINDLSIEDGSSAISFNIPNNENTIFTNIELKYIAPYLYIKYGKGLFRIKDNSLQTLSGDTFTEQFLFDTDNKHLYILDNKTLKKYLIDVDFKITKTVSIENIITTKPNIYLTNNCLYLSGYIIHGEIYIVRFFSDSLVKITTPLDKFTTACTTPWSKIAERVNVSCRDKAEKWGINLRSSFKDVLFKNNEIFVIDNDLKKYNISGELTSSITYNKNAPVSWIVGDNMNIYINTNNKIYFIKQYRCN